MFILKTDIIQINVLKKISKTSIIYYNLYLVICSKYKNFLVYKQYSIYSMALLIDIKKLRTSLSCHKLE